MTNISQKTFSIEGNIGSGKSTLLKLLHHEGIEVIPEPIEIWKNIKTPDGKNILGHYYDDDRNTYLFQTIAGITRAEVLNEFNSDIPLRICERSLYSDRIFGKVCLSSGKMRDIEKECYSYFMEWMYKKFEPNIAGIIYVKCDPDICIKRIGMRGRTEESGIDIEYLLKLHESHEEWLADYPKDKLLVIDGNQDNTDQRNEIIKNMVYNFIGLK